MGLVSSNNATSVKETIQKAVAAYRAKPDVALAVKALTALKGVGPATASLLLAVHDPQRVAFFGDEVFYWLCCGGKKGPIKYNAKEYQDLNERARRLAARLDVKAVDIERVAYVLINEGDAGVRTAGRAKVDDASKPSSSAQPKKQTTKRKQSSDLVGEDAAPVRRSKRGKPA